MDHEHELIQAWQQAALDLGIVVTSPFIFAGTRYPIHVPQFGRTAGALPLVIGDIRRRREAEAEDFFFSLLNPEWYFPYNRARYIETLVDWGWFGSPESAPRWYTEEVARCQT